MNVVRYDNQFNGNEWTVIVSLVVGAVIVLLLPQRFTKKTSAVYLTCGLFFGFFFDHTLSVLPISFYDLNDTSQFEVMDFMSHFVYAFYGYIFFYLYDFLGGSSRWSLAYILIWSFISVGIEKLGSNIGIFHYQHGYNIFYSFIIYLLVHSVWIVFYYVTETYGEKQF